MIILSYYILSHTKYRLHLLINFDFDVEAFFKNLLTFSHLIEI